MVEDEALGEHRPHGMAHEHEGQAGVLLAGQTGQGRHVVDAGGGSAGAEIAEAGDAGGEPMAAMVGGVDDVAGVEQRLEHRAIAAGVLTGPVGELQHRARLGRAGRPAIAGQGLAVGATVSERGGEVGHLNHS